ncbi:MAG: polymer-forming cytoskeletal protein [Bacteroidia bacterium]|nr:polymer-forming cytoskeletal protein [Bacteroidia bacterium]
MLKTIHMLGKDSKFLNHHIVNIIQSQTTINGDIYCKGDLRLDGIVKGNVKISGRLVMGQDAMIEGAVECENAEISGKIKGDIQVKETLHLKKHCVINGDIYTKKLVIESDAIFNGKCVMQTNSAISTQEANQK